jgi:Nif-specific regulatory protein
MDKNDDNYSVKQGVKELSLLYEISNRLRESMDLRDVMGPLLKDMAEHMGMRRGTLTMLNRQTNEITIDAAYGLSSSQRERGRYKYGEGITGRVVQTGQPMIVPNISEEPHFLDRTKARKKLKKKDISFICVPIKLGQEVIGALSVDRLFAPQVALDEDVRLLSIIASIIAQAVKLRQSVQEERERLMDENLRLKQELEDKFRPANIIGNSKAMRNVYDLMSSVSKADATVLIMGESGTGKELVAQAIHYNSLRSKKPFIKVNLAALPETVIESEMFGHEKGAFTGALNMRKGRFEMADGGTIFLDEIGDLPASIQIKLLRVLQEKEFERIGGNETIKSNVRVIAATNQDLENMIEENKFRQDLYYRLNVFPIYMPPLRDRKTDVPLLVDRFVEKYSKANFKEIKRISSQAINLLMSYHWPGNVRELENCIERAALVANDDVIHAHHFPPTLQTAESTGTELRGSLQETLDGIEKNIILDALKSSRGNMARAARTLGITERIMGLRVNKHDIDPKNHRTS